MERFLASAISRAHYLLNAIHSVVNVLANQVLLVVSVHDARQDILVSPIANHVTAHPPLSVILHPVHASVLHVLQVQINQRFFKK